MDTPGFGAGLIEEGERTVSDTSQGMQWSGKVKLNMAVTSGDRGGWIAKIQSKIEECGGRTAGNTAIFN
jgi:hypothetical protein